MSKILLGCVKWLRISGIAMKANIGSVPAWQRKLLANWIILMTVILLTPRVAFMLFRTADVSEIAESFYQLISIIGRTLQLLVAAVFRKRISRLLAGMQKFVDLKDSSCTAYGIAEGKAAFYCKTYERLIYITVALYVTTPAILEYQASRSPSRTVGHLDVGLFYDLYFFNVSNSPMREVCYITQALASCAAAVIVPTIDLLFCGLCLYVVAMYKELQRILVDRNREINTDNECEQRHTLGDCVEFHLAIIRFTESINTIYSNIIFAQYALSMLGICSSIFEVLLITDINYIRGLMTIISFIAGLFIYCWFGQMLHDETNNLQATIYDLRWYEYGLKEQKMIKLMLMRSQTPCGLAAYNYFECDLPTFFNIMTNVYSLVSFLQGVV